MLYFMKYSSYFYLLPPNAYINFGDSTVMVHNQLSHQTTAEHLVGYHAFLEVQIKNDKENILDE